MIPTAWILLLGWSPAELIPQADHLRLGFIYQRELVRHMGDWHQLLYWPGLGGGVKVHDVTGSLPFSQLLSWLESPPLVVANLQVLFLQLIFAYLCTIATVGLARFVFGGGQTTAFANLLLIALLFAFLPVIGWRITHGHDPIVIGLFVFLAFLVLYLDELNTERSMVNVAMSLLALFHVFQFNSFQLAYYSVLFGAPIILGFTMARLGEPGFQRLQCFFLPTGVFIAAVLVSMPKLYGILLNGFGDDQGRVVGSDAIYSYTVATPLDWLTSLPWSRDYIPEGRQVFTHHEVNYPLGPLVLLLILAKWTAAFRRVCLGTAVATLLILIVSMNLRPVSSIMVETVPMLESFRVPARAMLLMIVFLSMLAIAALLARFDDLTGPLEKLWQTLLLAGLLFVLTAKLPIIHIELALMGMVVVLLFIFRRLPTSSITVVLAMFAGGAINAFEERAHSPLADPISDEIVAPIRTSIYEQEPALEFPLNRVQLDAIQQDVGINTGFLLDISSMSSYWFPLSRYSRLFAALSGRPYEPTASAFINHPEAPGYRALNRLYNVGWHVAPTAQGVEVRRRSETFGVAWLADRIQWYERWSGLAGGLKTLEDKRELLLLASDDKTRRVKASRQVCEVKNDLAYRPSTFPYRFRFDVEGICYLIISMNYADILRAEDQDGRGLVTFPAYGALLGVVVDSAVKEVSVSPRVSTFPMIGMLQVMGFVLAISLVGLVAVRRQRM